MMMINAEQIRTLNAGSELSVVTNSPEETFAFAYALAQEAVAGDVYCLDGDLGAGKTLFAQGFGKGLGIDTPISSPTFTIVSEYEEGRLPLFHFDVYRIADPEEMFEIGFEEYLYRGGVCLIEWSVLIKEVLPAKRFGLYIERKPELGDNVRRIRICRY